MKALSAIAVGTASLLASGVTYAQSGNMMNGGMGSDGWMGGYGGGIWVPILVVIVVIGLVAWVVKQNGK